MLGVHRFLFPFLPYPQFEIVAARYGSNNNNIPNNVNIQYVSKAVDKFCNMTEKNVEKVSIFVFKSSFKDVIFNTTYLPTLQHLNIQISQSRYTPYKYDTSFYRFLYIYQKLSNFIDLIIPKNV